MARTDKSFLPQSKKEWTLVTILISFVVIGLFLSFGTERFGYYKVAGLSMEPTIHQWLVIPVGPENAWHRGAYVHVDKNAKPIVGSIVMFRHGKERDVKRVAYIREFDNAVWVIADNVGVTGADSREYGWIPRSYVVGVVDKIVTLQQFVRSLTAAGRFECWLTMRFAPSWIIYRNYPHYAVLLPNGGVMIDKRLTSLHPVGGESNNPILFDKINGCAYKLDRNAHLVGFTVMNVNDGVSFEPAQAPRKELEQIEKGGCKITACTPPRSFYRISAATILDGDLKAGWLGLPGFDAYLRVDFGSKANRSISVLQSGQLPGDVMYETSVDGHTWRSVQASIDMSRVSKESMWRTLSSRYCRYLRISNSMSSQWIIYEITVEP